MNVSSGLPRYPLIITSIWAVMTLIVILTSLYLCDGRLVYSLDDPYIQLKLANVILGGGYGINPSEYASPSSSILYAPMVATTQHAPMVATTQRLGLGSAGPLALDLVAAGSAVYLGSLFVERYVLGGAVTQSTAWFVFPLGVLLIFALSAVALPMTGLEHSWHVLLLVVMLFEFARMLSTDGKSLQFQSAGSAGKVNPLFSEPPAPTEPDSSSPLPPVAPPSIRIAPSVKAPLRLIPPLCFRTHELLRTTLSLR